MNAHTSIAVVETKIQLDSHADTCVVGDHCLIVHDLNRPVNVYGYNPKAGTKHAHLVNAAVLIPYLRQVKLLSFQSIRQLK